MKDYEYLLHSMQKLLTIFHKNDSVFDCFSILKRLLDEISPYIIIFENTDLMCESNRTH